MGQKHHSFPLNLIKKRSIIKMDSKIQANIICPFCSKEFNQDYNYTQFNSHLQECGINYKGNKENSEIYSPESDQYLNQMILNELIDYNNNISNNNDKLIDFEFKIEELHKEIKKRKISWEEGACQIMLNRSNFIEESINQIKNIDVYKEWKINFVGEVNNDAGGIMREWFTTIFKTLENNKMKLFLQSETDDFSYIINPFLKRNQKNFTYFDFIGKLMGKALIDNITVNICFNKLIYKMILEENVTFEDLLFINKPLYNSIKNLKNENQIFESTDLGLFYNIEIKDINDKVHSLDIISNGSNIPVTNIDDYINKRIEFMMSLYEPFIKNIRNSLYGIIPKNVIESFNADQLELLLNGRPFIDIEDWKQFTEYKAPYDSNHYIILWFWDILSELSQKELSNLLMFATGSSRVPLGGFSSLESNRGSNARFTIESIPYIPNHKNYIKAHTCFNRIDIPYFNNKDELQKAILFVCDNELLGFGID